MPKINKLVLLVCNWIADLMILRGNIGRDEFIQKKMNAKRSPFMFDSLVEHLL